MPKRPSQHGGSSGPQRDEIQPSEDDQETMGDLDQLMRQPSNAMRGNYRDDAIGASSITGRYHKPIIRAQNFDASHSTFNNVQGAQHNTVNVNVNNTFGGDQDKHDKILRWLSPTIPSTNYYQALRMCHPKTGQWFIEDERFLEWKANSSSLLWLHGKPGCGKTVLSAVVIRNISDSRDGTPEKPYAYFFFDGRDSQTGLQRHEQLVRSLIWQFATQAQQMPEAIETLYRQCGSGAQQPSVESLQRTLLLVLCQFDLAYLIVDALDECIDGGELLDWINDLMSREVEGLHVFATSREDVDIKIGLMGLSPISICLEGDSVNADITIYLDSTLRPDPKRKTWRDHADICNEVKASLTKGAQGMFRWVALQLDVLRGCRNRDQVKKQLSRLPKDLNETYDRMLARIDENDRDDAVKLFQWLAFSLHPLNLAELAEVVQVDFESRDLPWINSERRYDDTDDILRVCSGFVSVTDDGGVKLAHLSVKEYLVSSCWVPKFRITEATSHSLISQTCLAYLAQFEGQDYWDRVNLRDHPLAPYAAEHWYDHRRDGDVDDAGYLGLTLNLFRRDDLFLNWLKSCGVPSTEVENFKPIDYASAIGLNEVVRVLLEEGADVSTSAQGSIGLPLAAQSGHEVIVKMLLDHGADVEAKQEHYGTALQQASSGGHEAIVKLLLEHGADTNATSGYHGTALQRASSEGHEVIVKLLLEHGTDVNADDDSALWKALSGGHETIVKMLLEHGADINATSGYHGSALQQASSQGQEAFVKLFLEQGADVNANDDSALRGASSGGHENIVKMLLEHGADINAMSRNNASALGGASLAGHEAIVKLLLDHGADVNAKPENYETALQQASSAGHEAIVKLLLAHGADINATSGYHGSALHWASSAGHEAIVKLLLEHGADIDATSGYHSSALYWASLGGYEAIVKLLLEHGMDVHADNESALQVALSGGHETIVKMLLEHGADINTLSDYVGGALQRASSQGQEAFVKLLLEHGADVNARDDSVPRGAGYDNTVEILFVFGADINAKLQYNGSALQRASSAGHEVIVKLLLEHGADVNAKTEYRANALQSASFAGHEAIVQMLLEHGADINAASSYHGSALQRASIGGHTAIVNLLLEHGVDVNASTENYGNAIQCASFAGHESIVKILLEHGADINAVSGDDGSALQRASSRGHKAIVKLLLEHGADINVVSGHYGSAIQLASSRGHEAIVKLLLKHGADINAVSGHGVHIVVSADIIMSGHCGSPLQQASSAGHKAIVKLLLEHGADVNAVSAYSGSALEQASSRGHKAIVKMLLEHGADDQCLQNAF